MDERPLVAVQLDHGMVAAAALGRSARFPACERVVFA
jgi:hypothetical protein